MSEYPDRTYEFNLDYEEPETEESRLWKSRLLEERAAKEAKDSAYRQWLAGLKGPSSPAPPASQ